VNIDALLKASTACRCDPPADGYWGVTVTTNGSKQIRIWCYECGKAQTQSISHQAARRHGKDPDALPVIRNNTAQTIAKMCTRCGDVGAYELHHWAPYSLFADADDWPTSLLCPTCHSEWHETTGIAK